MAGGWRGSAGEGFGARAGRGGERLTVDDLSRAAAALRKIFADVAGHPFVWAGAAPPGYGTPERFRRGIGGVLWDHLGGTHGAWIERVDVVAGFDLREVLVLLDGRPIFDRLAQLAAIAGARHREIPWTRSALREIGRTSEGVPVFTTGSGRVPTTAAKRSQAACLFACYRLRGAGAVSPGEAVATAIRGARNRPTTLPAC